MRPLNAPQPPDPGDTGAADPQVLAALTGYAAGQLSEHAVLAALAASRLLVPVVAVLAGEETGPGGLRQEKSTEMALPTLVGRDGRAAVLAFTSLEALTRWRPDARPVPVPALRAWQAGAAEAAAVVIDVAGPVPFAVDGARLAAMASGQPAPMPHEDPDVLAALHAVLASEPSITHATPHAAPHANQAAATQDADLVLAVTLADGCGPAAADAAIRRAVTALLAATGGRLRRGVAVSLAS